MHLIQYTQNALALLGVALVALSAHSLFISAIDRRLRDHHPEILALGCVLIAQRFWL